MAPDYSKKYGARYERGLDVKTIAVRVRDDIKAGVKAGALPKGLKCSVRISRYSMGQSLDVSVKLAPGITIINPAYIAAKAAVPNEWPRDIGRTTDEASALLEELRGIVSAYNYDGSDSQTDYYDVNYAMHVGIDWKYEKELLEAGVLAVGAAVAGAKPTIHLIADCSEVHEAPALYLV